MYKTLNTTCDHVKFDVSLKQAEFLLSLFLYIAVLLIRLTHPCVFFFSAADDIPHADEVRTLIKDIWDLRIAKLRKSIDIMVSQQEVYARVSTIVLFYAFLHLIFTHCFSTTWKITSTSPYKSHEPPPLIKTVNFILQQYLRKLDSNLFNLLVHSGGPVSEIPISNINFALNLGEA